LLSQRNTAGRFLRVTKKLRGNETGVSLIETLVALAVLGLIAVAFLGGLATFARATLIADEQATAESLARTEMEHIKSQEYIDYADPGHEEYGLVVAPVSYSVEITTVPINLDTGQPLLSGDQGIQKITVTVIRNEKVVLTIEDYKVDR